MKKEIKTKRITIDKLAIMMNNGFESLEKKMATKTDIEGLKGQLEGVNKRIDDFVTTRVKYEDHNKLKGRVTLIEDNLEIKS